jgi:hypothetical protein
MYNVALTKEDVNINFSAGLHDELLQKESNVNIIVSPNPCQNIITINIIPQDSSGFVAPASLNIMDTYGRILYGENIFDPSMGFMKTYDISILSEGIYYLQFFYGQEHVTQKFIKQ